MREKRLRKIIGITVIITIIVYFGVVFNACVYADPITTTTTTTGTGTTGGTATTTTGTGTTSGTSTQTTTTTSTEQKKSLKKSERKGVGDILKAATTWINGAEKTENTEVDDFVNQFVGIGQLLVIAGVIVILITIGITGIRWITASPDKQAKLKEQLIGLVIATVVIFGAVGIWNLVRGIMMKVEDDYLTTGNSETIIVAENQIK